MTSSARARIDVGIARPSSFAVFRADDEIELDRLLNRQIAGFDSLQDAVDIVGGAAEVVHHVRPIGHQAAVVGIAALGVDRRQMRPVEKRDNVPACRATISSTLPRCRGSRRRASPPVRHCSAWRSLADQVLPRGIAFEWTDLAFQQQQRGTPTILVFGAAALFVFLVLVAQYESWKLPLAIFLIVPMCLLASVTGLLARGMPIDILAQIGFVVLVGLAAKKRDPDCRVCTPERGWQRNPR